MGLMGVGGQVRGDFREMGGEGQHSSRLFVRSSARLDTLLVIAGFDDGLPGSGIRGGGGRAGCLSLVGLCCSHFPLGEL